MKKQVRYFQFPLRLIQKVHEDHKEGMQAILKFTLVDFAMRQEVELDDAIRQLIYNVLRGGGLPGVIKQLKKHGYPNKSFLEDADKKFFANDGEERWELIAELEPLFNKDPILKELALKNCRLSKVNNFFGVTGPGPEAMLSDYQALMIALKDQEGQFGADPRPTIATELFFDLESQMDTELFTAYMAIRSLEGNKKFVATNRPIIAMRMAGAKSRAILESNETMQAIYEKYNQRYRFKKILERLERRSLVKSYLFLKEKNMGYPKHFFFISTKLEPEQLGEAVAAHLKKKNLIKKRERALGSFKQYYNETSD